MTADVSVQLTYTVTLREISDGLKLQMRHSPAGRWAFRVLWGVGIFLGLVITIDVAVEAPDYRPWVLDAIMNAVVVIAIACRWLDRAGPVRIRPAPRRTWRSGWTHRDDGCVSARHTNHAGTSTWDLTEGRGWLMLPPRTCSEPEC